MNATNNASSNDDDTNNNRSHGDDGPANKRLRCTEPDLTVILQWMDDVDEPQTKECKMYTSSLAKQSKFVDACLSVNMKEKATREITFHDVTPQLFEKALQFIEDPLAARSMEPKDALQVAEFYDKFALSSGIALCDEVLDKFLSELRCDGHVEDLDLLVDSISTATALGFLKAKTCGQQYLENVIPTNLFGSTFGPTMFTLDHIKKLHPLFKQGIVDHYIEGLTDEELNSALFPKYFVTHYTKEYSKGLLVGKKINLKGTNIRGGDGILKHFLDSAVRAYYLDKNSNFDGHPVDIWLTKAKHESDWAIVVKSRNWGPLHSFCLWKCPHSRNLDVAPKGPWEPVHPLVCGARPVVEYN